MRKLEQFRSLLDAMVTLDNTKRITCGEALKHPFVVEKWSFKNNEVISHIPCVLRLSMESTTLETFCLLCMFCNVYVHLSYCSRKWNYLRWNSLFRYCDLFESAKLREILKQFSKSRDDKHLKNASCYNTWSRFWNVFIFLKFFLKKKSWERHDRINR